MVAIYTPDGKIIESTRGTSRKLARRTAADYFGAKWRVLWMHGYRVHAAGA